MFISPRASCPQVFCWLVSPPEIPITFSLLIFNSLHNGSCKQILSAHVIEKPHSYVYCCSSTLAYRRHPDKYRNKAELWRLPFQTALLTGRGLPLPCLQLITAIITDLVTSSKAAYGMSVRGLPRFGSTASREAEVVTSASTQGLMACGEEVAD